MSRKRPRERPNVNEHLVAIYDDLANVDETIRVRAACSLVKDFAQGSEEEQTKILRRLFRGLCSGRDAARIGFSIALSEFLRAIFSADSTYDSSATARLRERIQLLESLTSAPAGASGQEVRDHSLGRLFGVEAFLNSRLLASKWTDSETIWKSLFDLVLNLAVQKLWLREQCSQLIYNFIQTLGPKAKSAEPLTAILHGLVSRGLAKTPEGVAIWIAAYSKDTNESIYPFQVWQNNDPLGNDRGRKEVCRVLQQAANPKDDKSSSPSMDENQQVPKNNHSHTGYWLPHVHFSWKVVIDQLLRTQDSSTAGYFAEFWSSCVGEYLFGSRASKERKYQGLMLLEQTLRREDLDTRLRVLFHPNVHRSLIDQLAVQDRYLHRAADKCRKAMLDGVDKGRLSATELSQTLMTLDSETIDFDARSKTKTFATILASAISRDESGSCVQSFESMISSSSQSDETSFARTKLGIDSLYNAIVISVPNQTAWNDICANNIKNALKCLWEAAHSISAANDTRQDKSSLRKLQDLAKSRINSIFNHLSSKDIPVTQLMASLAVWIWDCKLDEKAIQFQARSLLFEFDEMTRSILKDSITKLKALEILASEASGSTVSASVDMKRLLLAFTFLEVFDEDSEAVTILHELNDSFPDSENCSSSDQLKVDLDSTIMLVELLLSFLVRPEPLPRRLALQAFALISERLDEHALVPLFKVLETQESLSGQQELMDRQDVENGEETDMSEDDYESEEDVKGLETKKHEDKSSGADSDSVSVSEVEASEMSSTDGESEAEDDAELAAFDAKLAEALSTRAIDGSRTNENEKDENEDEDEDEDSDVSDMTDSQMFSLDKQLETIFRQRKASSSATKSGMSKKQEQKDARAAVVQFKSRVLDVLNVILKNERERCPKICATIGISILKFIRLTGNAETAKKACNIIRDFARAGKKGKESRQEHESTTSIPTQELLDHLRCVHEEVGHDASNAHTAACSQISLFLVKVLVASDRELLREVVHLYAKSQERNLFDSSVKIKTSFFSDWLNWCASAP